MISFQKSFCNSLAILTLLHWLCLCTFGKWAKTVMCSPHHAPCMYITSLWLLWSCCYMDVPTLGHLRIPGALVVCGTVRTRGLICPTLSMWYHCDGTHESWWQPQAGNSVSPITHTEGRCCLGMCWWHEISLILSVYPDLHLKYSRCTHSVWPNSGVCTHLSGVGRIYSSLLISSWIPITSLMYLSF